MSQLHRSLSVVSSLADWETGRGSVTSPPSKGQMWEAGLHPKGPTRFSGFLPWFFAGHFSAVVNTCEAHPELATFQEELGGE